MAAEGSHCRTFPPDPDICQVIPFGDKRCGRSSLTAQRCLGRTRSRIRRGTSTFCAARASWRSRGPSVTFLPPSLGRGHRALPPSPLVAGCGRLGASLRFRALQSRFRAGFRPAVWGPFSPQEGATIPMGSPPPSAEFLPLGAKLCRQRRSLGSPPLFGRTSRSGSEAPNLLSPLGPRAAVREIPPMRTRRSIRLLVCVSGAGMQSSRRFVAWILSTAARAVSTARIGMRGPDGAALCPPRAAPRGESNSSPRIAAFSTAPFSPPSHPSPPRFALAAGKAPPRGVSPAPAGAQRRRRRSPGPRTLVPQTYLPASAASRAGARDRRARRRRSSWEDSFHGTGFGPLRAVRADVGAGWAESPGDCTVARPA